MSHDVRGSNEGFDSSDMPALVSSVRLFGDPFIGLLKSGTHTQGTGKVRIQIRSVMGFWKSKSWTFSSWLLSFRCFHVQFCLVDILHRTPAALGFLSAAPFTGPPRTLLSLVPFVKLAKSSTSFPRNR